MLDERAIELAGERRGVEPLGYLEMLALVAGADASSPTRAGCRRRRTGSRPVRDAAPEHRMGRHGRGRRERARRADRSSPAALAAARFPADAPPLYGDGHAAERIAAALYA